jgi:hypothetical protein
MIALRSYLIAATNTPKVNAEQLYQIGALIKIRDELNASKSKLDALFSKEEFQAVWNGCDPFKIEKKRFAQIANAQHVSNAWLKCYEMICYYKLIPTAERKDPFLHFDNAAFPGSFILAAHHFAVTRTASLSETNLVQDVTKLVRYEWRGSSLIEQNELNAAPISDKYGLYRNYKDNWLMSAQNNGDVLLRANQEDFMARLAHGADLYTSDLGFDVSSDFNNQELIQCPANIGQIISGLLTLREGGNFITKQYSIFEPITISIMYAAAHFFEKFYLCKPATSRAANSETYLVGIGFKMPKDYVGDDIIDHPYIAAMFNRIETKSVVPLFLPEDYPKGFLKGIRDVAQELASSQIEKIEADIKRYESGDPTVVSEFIASIEPDIEEWYAANYVVPISDELQLNAFAPAN